MRHPAPDPDLGLEYLTGTRPPGLLLSEARRMRDEGHGNTITYSRKVFIPLTTLCRDTCTYCTFAKPPGAGGRYLEPDEVTAVAAAGQALGCTEALFTLGDRPEDRWSQARSFLRDGGYSSTIDYVRAMTELVVSETSLLPHANPGLMSEAEIASLRPSNPSMGLMLENISERLMEPGMPHYGCPDKHPAARVATIEAAARQRVPFTTGLLIGIGESHREIIDSLFALERLQQQNGHLQEIIIQNFRAKPATRMRRSAEPIPPYLVTVTALARWIFGPEMNIQVPPNLTDRFEIYLEAGVNDWGGVSPLTPDWVNPELPWPHLDELEARTEAAGFQLLPRLPVYPRFMTSEWIDESLRPSVLESSDSKGYALVPQLERTS